MRFETDVLVVGAGVSGLAVADAVVRGRRRVTVLEARGRTGGRLLREGASLDLGATWFWGGEERTRAMVQRFGISTFAQYLEGDTMYEDHRGVQRLRGNLVDVPAVRFDGGAARLTDELAAVLPEGTVELGCVVEAVGRGEVDGDALVVTTADGRTWRADHVVLALPPALAMAAIRLAGDLPAELRRIATATPVWMGDTVKVVAVYDEPFWRSEGLAGAGVSRVGPLREIHDMSGADGRPAALFGFAPAPSVELDLGDRVREQLVRLFGPRAARPGELVVQNWNAEVWTVPPHPDAGAAVAASRDFTLFGHPVYQHPALHGRLHWASTETSRSHPGHIEGALEAAERAARAILT